MQKNCAINVENSINSGQVFLWKKNGDYWYGINGQDVLHIDKNGVTKSYQNLKTDFFRKNDVIDDIIKSISKDKTVRKAVKKILWFKNSQTRPFSMFNFIYCFIKL